MSDGATREMPGEMRARAPAAAAARRVAAGVLLLLPLPLNTGLAAQDASVERVPTLPNGVPVVVFPVQSAVPPAGGGRAGDTGIGGRAIDLLNAELAFAFGEEAGARGWALESAVEARLARNPTIGVDPRRLAYHGLLRDPGPRRDNSTSRCTRNSVRWRPCSTPVSWFCPFPSGTGGRTARRTQVGPCCSSR
ncbi:hypothetical protein [Candidatus Palauibacter sp.]|uniref:hypothetical protein n=1 Tax=Candidatus Palauibacter sp. TaxID=3101350 RepID=UPI003AF27121